MKPQDLLLRCYAEETEEGQWQAICLDLNLAAQADTLDEVKRKLNSQVLDYVRDAFAEDSAYGLGLMKRRAPLNYWVKYYLCSTLVRIQSTFRINFTFTPFDSMLPLSPA